MIKQYPILFYCPASRFCLLVVDKISLRLTKRSEKDTGSSLTVDFRTEVLYGHIQKRNDQKLIWSFLSLLCPGQDLNVTRSVPDVDIFLRHSPRNLSRIGFKSLDHNKRLAKASLLLWCPGQDLNLHALRRYHLKVVSLPISPPGRHFVKRT